MQQGKPLSRGSTESGRSLIRRRTSERSSTNAQRHAAKRHSTLETQASSGDVFFSREFGSLRVEGEMVLGVTANV